MVRQIKTTDYRKISSLNKDISKLLYHKNNGYAVCNNCGKNMFPLNNDETILGDYHINESEHGKICWRMTIVKQHYECNAFEISVLLKGKRPPKWLTR